MLVVLEVVVGSEVGRQIKIPQDRTCKIGRTNYSDEAFTDDVMMSGQHFEIRNDGKYCWLRDLDSRNGTRVDNDFVKDSLTIRDGQKVFAGRTEFTVKIEGGAKNPYESTSLGIQQPVRNVSLMSTTYGSKIDVENDPRFPKAESDPQQKSKPGPPAAPAGPPTPPGAPVPPPSGMPHQPPSGNLELPPTGDAAKFSPPGYYPPPEFAKPDTGTDPGVAPSFPPHGHQTPPGPTSHGTSKSPPWAQSASPPTTPGQPIPGQVAPGQLPPGTPPPGQPHFSPSKKRGGDEGPIFKFAKGGGEAPMGPPPGMPPTFRHTPGMPPGSPPGSPVETPPVGSPGGPQLGDPRFQSPPPSHPSEVPGAPPSFEVPGQPPRDTPPNFTPNNERPLPPGTPRTPPGAPPSGYHSFDEPTEPPHFSDFTSPPVSPEPELPGNKLGPPGSQSPPPWEAQAGFGDAKNPNLDFGSDEFDPNIGPALDFGDEADDDDEPLFGPPPFAGGSGPSFTNQMGPSGGNPNLVGFSPDEPPANKFTAPPAEETPFPASGSSENMIEPAMPATPSNWRNPDYVSVAPPPSQMGEAEQAAGAASPDSVRGLCFKEETADSGYPVYHSIIEGVPQVPFSPFALISELAKVAKPVLSIHFMRAEMQIPENLGGTPLRGDLDAKFAALGGPMLYCPEDLEPFRDIINELWGLDAISCMFTSGDPQGVVDHFREGLFAPKRGDLPTPGPGPQFFAVFSPNLLTTFLSQRDQDTVDQLLGAEVIGVLAEVADMPESWQLFTKKSWAESLKKLGMNRVVEQPQ